MPTRFRSSIIVTLAAPYVAAFTIAGPASAQTGASAAADPPVVRYVLAEDGNEARYRVREQLARIKFPSDAVGSTSEVQGGIAIASDGTIVSAVSRFVVDLASLTTDSDRRDSYVRRRVFVSDSFPEAVFVPEHIDGVTLPIGAAETTFRLTGDLTIHGVTRPTTWDVTASRDGDAIVGTATTRFHFADFQLTVPRVRSVLSVVDDIRLEYDFRLVPENVSR